MKVTKKDIEMWNSLCKKQEGWRRTTYKINRAIAMGKVAHIYHDKNIYLIVYYDIKIAINFNGDIMKIWKDKLLVHNISRKTRKKFDDKYTHAQCLRRATEKHFGIIKRISETKSA